MHLLLLAACTDEPEPKPAVEETAAVDTRVSDTGDSTPPVDTAPTEDSAPPDDTAPGDSGPRDTAPVDTGPAGPPTAATCFADLWDGAPTVDYDQFAPVLGTHCKGTDHQEITGVERVVFVGDSITVGSPPTGTSDWYRNQLADALVDRFGLEAPGWDWENVDLFDGVVYTQESGDFASCAKWGARTDDLLMAPHMQMEACMPEDTRDKVTLVVMTIGGNDIYSLLEDVNAGVDETTLRATYDEAVGLLREAVEWVVEPGRFPNGVYLVFANTYDFTDSESAADMSDCEGAQLIGLDEPLQTPITWSILADAQEAYLQMAVETGTDMVFLGEQFCGHGYNADAETARCHRGSDNALWYDLTCMHPNDLGHAAIADMFLSVIDE
jgi:hypothetical protein